MASKKKVATSVAAVATAAALLLGGTFAWQSISQTALNEASDVVNPGGRLHNDMWYVSAKENNNDIYVENFAEDDIFARVRLSEYMEIVMNYDPNDPDAAQTKVENVAGTKTLKAGGGGEDAATQQDLYDYTYDIHYFDQTNATDEYWTWDTDGSDAAETYFMPTFNVNKDSLAPDLNGLYRDRVGGISNRGAGQYERYDESGTLVNLDGLDYEGYADGETLFGYEIYDGDSNDADEIGTDPAVLSDIITNGDVAAAAYDVADAIMLAYAEHTAKPVGTTNGLISMTDWLDKLNSGENTADYWVYDEDGSGWVYWSSPIAGRNEDGTTNTTGLLLDGTTLKQVMDDTWYYAIEVTGQFITANDLGSPDDNDGNGSGFYRDGETVSDNALTLLETIGVGKEESTGDDVPEPEAPLQLTVSAAPSWYLPNSSTEAKVTLTAAAAYEGTDIEDLSGVTWEISGNSEVGTALDTDTGESVILTIAANEKNNITVTASFTYTDEAQGIDETAVTETVVTNGPSVGMICMYDNDAQTLISFAKYQPGTAATKRFTMYFFENYYTEIPPVGEAYSGEAAELLAQKLTYTLVKEAEEGDYAEITMEGVTISQNDAELTVTIAETVTDPILIKCALENYGSMIFDIKPNTGEEEQADVKISIAAYTDEGLENAFDGYWISKDMTDPLYLTAAVTKNGAPVEINSENISWSVRLSNGNEYPATNVNARFLIFTYPTLAAQADGSCIMQRNLSPSERTVVVTWTDEDGTQYTGSRVFYDLTQDYYNVTIDQSDDALQIELNGLCICRDGTYGEGEQCSWIMNLYEIDKDDPVNYDTEGTLLNTIIITETDRGDAGSEIEYTQTEGSSAPILDLKFDELQATVADAYYHGNFILTCSYAPETGRYLGVTVMREESLTAAIPEREKSDLVYVAAAAD